MEGLGHVSGTMRVVPDHVSGTCHTVAYMGSHHYAAPSTHGRCLHYACETTRLLIPRPMSGIAPNTAAGDTPRCASRRFRPVAAGPSAPPSSPPASGSYRSEEHTSELQ